MGEQEPKKIKKHISVGLLAHVDAGKTTLSEAVLYLSGMIRECGRVDKKNAFLDNFELERERGITIFSKQAVLALGDMQVTLLDTPGHVDFSAEMERTLQVLDYAVLVINGADGVQSHTRTLWRLLARYRIPVFLFINKMDQFAGEEQEAARLRLLKDVRDKLDSACVDFDEKQDSEQFFENLAVCDENVLERYLEQGEVSGGDIVRMISERKLFPCYFGSALKHMGVEAFLRGMERYMEPPGYPEAFGAKVYKIARDAQGNRLTYMKITGGSLRVKTVLTNKNQCGQEEIWEEKADQIRIYSGARYESVTEAFAGTVCAVTGLGKTYAGQGLGWEKASDVPVLEPVLSYQVQIPEDCDVHQALRQLHQLEEEQPELHIVWDEKLGEIHAKLMGEVQTEVLQSLVMERFGVSVNFGAGSIVYKETIARPAEGIGHFEPLRHYAEVHLLLEPLEAGSGLVFDTDCSEDVLDRNWQRLILTHLEEKEHIGVLTGSAVTDMKITLVNGRAHLKHTEGGDFRQATYRAVRQGLKRAQSVLLEPYYEFRLEVPSANVGRAMTDIQKRYGSFEQPVTDGEMTVIAGRAPVVAMRDYQREVISYTKGMGRLSCIFGGYAPCHNAAEVIEQIGYDSERDLENPTGSVFCAHGAGFVVSWDQVPEYMHLEELGRGGGEEEDTETFRYGNPKYGSASYQSAEYGSSAGSLGREDKPLSSAEYKKRQSDYWAGEKELEDIFTRTYGAVKRELPAARRTVTSAQAEPRYVSAKRKTSDKEYLLVDGYNIIFAWDELKELAKANIDSARDRLKDILCNYQGYKKCTLILVFDAYRVQGHREEIEKYHNIYVVYTKEAETADMFIEKTVHAIGKKYQVTVATSDGLEQVIILGQGGGRLSAQGLREEIELAKVQMREHYDAVKQGGRSYLGEYIPEEVRKTEPEKAGKVERGTRKPEETGKTEQESRKNERGDTGNTASDQERRKKG